MSQIIPGGWLGAIKPFAFSLLAALLYWAGIFFVIAPIFTSAFERVLLCSGLVLWGACIWFAARAPSFGHLLAVAAGLAWGSALWWCILISLQNGRVTVVYPWLSVPGPGLLAVTALPCWWLARWFSRRRHAG
jgi:hypothetical protein